MANTGILFGKYPYLLTCQELNEKIDTTHIREINMGLLSVSLAQHEDLRLKNTVSLSLSRGNEVHLTAPLKLSSLIHPNKNQGFGYRPAEPGKLSSLCAE